MPTLALVGKEKVVNHHHDVPFRVLIQQKRFNASEGSLSNNGVKRLSDAIKSITQ